MVQQTCLPIRICPYKYGNLPAVLKYTRISQNMDRVSRKYGNSDVNDVSLLPEKLFVEC